MASKSVPQFLRLVHSETRSEQREAETRTTGKAQDAFLPSDDPTMLVFVSWRRTSLATLQDLFSLCRPRLVLDLRAVPHFDLDGLSRRAFFEMLRASKANYIDLLGRIDVKETNNAALNPSVIATHVDAFSSRLQPPSTGPLMFLHDDDFVDDKYVTALASALPCGVTQGWQVYRPAEGRTKDSEATSTPTQADQSDETAAILSLDRRTLFISHATPEDNSFVAWLAAKLTAAGYEVWCDIANLSGGDVFWGDIESVIRHRAAKVIYVQSEFAKAKPGVRKEVYLALTVAKKLNLPRFILPLRIDATPFDETFIELIDLQAIDCRRDWMIGLRTLLSVLDRDDVPKDTSFKSAQFLSLANQFGISSYSVSQSSEPVVSNLLSIPNPPETINFLDFGGIPTNRLQELVSAVRYPAFVFQALVATTATLERYRSELDAAGVRGISGRIRASITWQDFLNARYGDLPSWKRGEARNQAFALLNKAWRSHLLSKGTREGTLANGRYFWFFSDKKIEGNVVKFSDYSGKSIRRQLVGYSKKRRVYWHFALTQKALQETGEFVFALTPHVTFSEDGQKILSSASQLHSLRRSFCRSWWNDRWRDLMQGFVSSLAGGSQFLSLDVGAERAVEVSASLMQYSAPVSLVHSISDAPYEIEASEELVEDFSDEDDDGDDFEGFQ